MAKESELATLNRRVTLLEDDAKGEKLVSRHILRKVSENENLLLGVQKQAIGLQEQMVGLQRQISELRTDFVTLRADLPIIIASTVSAILREELSLRKV